MVKAGYRIELDFFSGLQNPSVEIAREDFVTLYDEVVKLEKTEPGLFYDGLGFRGIVFSGMKSTFIYIQNKIIRLETLNNVTCFKSNPDIILKAINLFKKYDKESNYKILIEKAIDEYL
jgi:hypothetical protein